MNKNFAETGALTRRTEKVLREAEYRDAGIISSAGTPQPGENLKLSPAELQAKGMAALERNKHPGNILTETDLADDTANEIFSE